MFEHHPKPWLAAAICVLSFLSSQPAVAREAPGPGCIDLQALTGGWRSDERELLLRAPGDGGARLELDAACPRFPEGVDLVTLAPGGWACPGATMFVRGDGITCPVARMAVLSAPQLDEALRARAARMLAAVDLDPVLVQGRRWRDILGTTDRCVDKRFLRGWSARSDGLVVEVSPARHSGHRFYLVETVEPCSDLHHAFSVELIARSRGAAVCGRPGDRILLRSHGSVGLDAMGGPPSRAFSRGCEVKRVTPLTRD